MAGITLEIAEKHLDEWLNAELEVTTNQSYTIGTRSLTRANLSEIRKQVEFWESKVAQLRNRQAHKSRNRVFRVVPRDL